MPYASDKIYSTWSSAIGHHGRLRGLIALVHAGAFVLRGVQSVYEGGVILVQ